MQAVLPHFFRSYEKRCQKSTRRVCAPSRLPWGWGTICTFFACTKKVPKKYTEGLRALSTPGDAVKFLRFDGDTGNFTVCGNARMRSFSLLFSDMGLTQAEFYEIFEFLLYWVLVLYLSFRAGIYGTKTGMVSRKMKLVFFTCLSAKLQRRFAAREYCSGASPPGGFLWGSAPNPARFFEKSVGKTMFYRKVSHSLRSCDTLRLFLFYLKLNFSLTDEFMIGKWTRFRKK